MPKGTAQKVLQILLTVTTLCYPLIVYAGMTQLPLQWLAGLVVILFIARVIVARQTALVFLRPLAVPVAIGGTVLAVSAMLMANKQALLLYPVLVNTVCFSVFAWSLYRSPSIIECFARLTEKRLSAEAVRYTRNVTKIWCLFFIVNGGIAACTFLHGDMAVWALYNGLLSYILMGTLLGTEWIYRKWVLKV